MPDLKLLLKKKVCQIVNTYLEEFKSSSVHTGNARLTMAGRYHLNQYLLSVLLDISCSIFYLDYDSCGNKIDENNSLSSQLTGESLNRFS